MAWSREDTLTLAVRLLRMVVPSLQLRRTTMHGPRNRPRHTPLETPRNRIRDERAVPFGMFLRIVCAVTRVMQGVGGCRDSRPPRLPSDFPFPVRGGAGCGEQDPGDARYP